MKDISPILRALGLLDSEIKTYLTALERGPRTVLDLAKLTKLSRQAIYVAIESLTERGLMSSSLQGKKRFYAAEPPDKLHAYAKRRETEMKERMNDLERILPELELKVGGEKPVVKLFEGKEGVLSIIRDLAVSRSSNNEEIADLHAMWDVLSPEDLKPMQEELKKANAHVRGLYSGLAKGKTLTSDRFTLPEKYTGFKSNITVYGKDKIAFVVFTGKMHSIVIESEHLAKTMRILFDLSLHAAREFPTQ